MSVNFELMLGSTDVSNDKIYDLIIVGGGPGGLSAGIYAARYRMDTLLVEKGICGGQMGITEYVENYPGFDEPILGQKLGERMENQAKRFGLSIVRKDITKVDFSKPIKSIYSYDEELKAKTIIIATGAEPNKLNIPGELEGIGRGVSYCATCDGPFYKNQIVAVVGGGDSAVEEAIYLTKYASKVYLVHRRDKFRAAKIAVERAEANEKIEFVLNSVVREVVLDNDGFVKGINIESRKSGDKNFVDLNGIFIFVGYTPSSSLFEGQVKMNSHGWILTDDLMQTDVKGVYAVGDVRSKNLRQIVTAVADGAVAAHEANKYVENFKES